MADPKKMSVEEILAACRGVEPAGTGGDDVAVGKDQSAGEPSAPKSSAPEPSAPKSSAGQAPGEMSVADILAAARGADAGGAEKVAQSQAKPAAATTGGKKAADMSAAEIFAAARGGGAETPEKKSSSVKKPLAKGTAKASSKTPATAVTGPKDTSSILAAARNPTKSGPLSKSEAAAKVAEKKVQPKGKVATTVPPMPEKPAYAKQVVPQLQASEEGRRGFMLGSLVGVFFGSFLALGFTSLGICTALGSLGLARFMFPNILIEPPSKFKIGFPSDFAPDTVTTKFKAQFGVWVVNVEFEGLRQINAIKSVCTHLGCTPNWLEGEQKFKCPCHGSGFYKDGINFEGPAPRPLERYAVRIADDGQLEIDKSKKYQQEMGQWSDPASFVAV